MRLSQEFEQFVLKAVAEEAATFDQLSAVSLLSFAGKAISHDEPTFRAFTKHYGTIVGTQVGELLGVDPDWMD